MEALRADLQFVMPPLPAVFSDHLLGDGLSSMTISPAVTRETGASSPAGLRTQPQPSWLSWVEALFFLQVEIDCRIPGFDVFYDGSLIFDIRQARIPLGY